MATLKTKLIIRNDTTANWTSNNTVVLSKGEIGIEWTTQNNTLVPKIKIGDGETAWSSLAYFGGSFIITGSGNTIVDASFDSSSGTLTLTKGNRVTGSSLTADQFIFGNGGNDVKASGKTLTTTIASSATDASDSKIPTEKAVRSAISALTTGVSSIKVTDDNVVNIDKNTTQTGDVEYSISHAAKGPSSAYTSGNTTTSIGAGESKTIKIPQLTVDTYGHTTAASDESVTITIPSVSSFVGGRGNGTANSLAKWSDANTITAGPSYGTSGANKLLQLDSSGKINLSTLPDILLGQLVYGGTVNGSTAVATLSDNAKIKLGTTSNTITLTNNTTAITGYTANEGIFYIVSTDGNFASLDLLVGDWLISTGSAWKKIDNTDAVTGVKGNAETNYRIGQVNITPANIGVSATSTSVTVGGTTFNKYVHPTYTTHAAAAVKIGNDETGHVSIGDPLLASDIKITSSGIDTVSSALDAISTDISNIVSGTTEVGKAKKLGSSTVGSSTKPIYLSSGTATECSTYAGGTAVTLNGTSKAATTASFYAPTSSGSANQFLISSGSGAPTWKNITVLDGGSASTTNWGEVS